ncbi:TLC domain-containing protein 2-like isoform X2 [Physella acuta]|uniref:TLC domain-containing protein 2-like isoform X2 n=1 Tax=Physella acuta TaxID=109671 RepID=UPI0027DC993B|nr:TLC domain-containing protein 2-like isoform X2 [Physella acuta]
MNNGDEPDYTRMREAIELTHGHIFILGTIVFFSIINWIIKTKGPPKSLSDEEWKWRNLYVSWVHAFCSSVWVLSSMIFCSEMFSDLFHYINHFTYFCVCFGTGYFIYDSLDLLVNNRLLQMWEVVLHHLAVTSMFYYNVNIRAQIAFSIVALSVEVNSFFLHWRKLLQMVKTPFDSPLYLTIKYINLVTFAVFRGVPLYVITYSVFTMGHMVTTAYYIGICLSMFVMDVLNVILFWRLLKSDLLRGPSGSPRSKQHSALHHESKTNGHVTSNNHSDF